MYKKQLLIMSSFIIFNSLYIETAPENNNPIIGAVLFTTTAIGMTAIAKKNQQRKEDEATKLVQALINENNNRTKIKHQQLATKFHTKQPLRLTYTPEWHCYKNSNKQPLRLTYMPEWHRDRDSNNQLIQQAIIPKKILAPLPEKLTIPRRIAQSLFAEEARVIDEMQEEEYAKKSTAILREIDQLYRENNIEEMQTLITRKMGTPFSDYRSQNKKDFHSSSQTSANKNGTISTKHTFRPVTPLPKKIIFLEVVHGTGGRPHAYGQDTNRALSQSFLIYAQRLAIEQNAMVYLDVVQWSGKLGPRQIFQELGRAERRDAGTSIAEEIIAEIKDIQEQNKDSIISIQTIGHSHGCNVINFMAQKLHTKGIVIDNAVSLASPRADIETSNIKETLNIFGNLDFTGSMGSMLSSWGKTSSMRDDGKLAVKNIVLKSEGQDLNHSTIKTAISFLPSIQKYLQQNFSSQSDLILDIYDNNKNLNDQQYDTEDADEDGFFDAQPVPTPDYQIAGIIDDVYAQIACDFEAHDTGDHDALISDQNKQAFEERYQHSIYKEPTFIDKAISDGESIQIPSWILTTLKQSQNAVGSAGQLMNRVVEQFCYWRSTSPTSTSSTIDPIDQIYKKIAEAKIKIEEEAYFKNKSIIIAELYATAQECDDLDMQMRILQQINGSFVEENNKMTQWQNYYECIIGRTRSDITKINFLTPQAQEQFPLAQAIFKKAQADQEKKWTEILDGYEKLDPFVQQAINSALEQQLKNPNIDIITSDYLQKCILKHSKK